MDLEDASKTGLQKRVRYHMDLEVMPSAAENDDRHASNEPQQSMRCKTLYLDQ